MRRQPQIINLAPPCQRVFVVRWAYQHGDGNIQQSSSLVTLKRNGFIEPNELDIEEMKKVLMEAFKLPEEGHWLGANLFIVFYNGAYLTGGRKHDGSMEQEWIL